MRTEVIEAEAPRNEPALRAIAMPADANPHGDIFGGRLLSQMDLAGSTVAIRRARSRVATVAITGMAFRKPVLVGDEVNCYAEVTRVGTMSITIKTLKVTEGLHLRRDRRRPVTIGHSSRIAPLGCLP
jgi:acyl-CoA hydrolase